ncbi:GNAT family N-acetyltransferase [Phaeovulum veldkampii]|nr:GNAT family N-acetyltransferase [Phaeovulum veldkampii]TDQ63357.1 acetyltransferase (GNAT) family protein [Phaeovulum veldkampii DSM 11550]
MVSIRRGLAPDQRAAAAALYWLAFGGKLGRVMGPAPRALAFIERVIAADHVLVAVGPQGTLLGVAGFRTWEGAFVGGGLGDLVAVYGPFGGLWRSACLSVLARETVAHGFIVDGIAVRPDHRGAGIGAALIEALCTEARARGHAEMRLDVVEENIRARALYERLGFAVRRRISSRLTRLLFDFHGTFVMVRRL